jgi:hypothetical protein
MNLYELHDDPGNVLDWEERTCLSVWADTPDEARTIYLRRLPSLTEYDEEFLASLVPVCKPATWKGDEFQPEIATPHEERRPEVLRSLGWAYECERRCEACDLAPFGEDRFRVCGECGLCRECRAASQIERCEDCQDGDEAEGTKS